MLIMKRIKYHAQVNGDLLKIFQQNIQEWYRREGRDLPWRHTVNPYWILVSEILLHQTTVKTVQPVYEKFVQTFPAVEDLASASIEAVKEITDPLGYKVRGQWLWDIAQTVANDLGGEFPNDLEGLLSLPGIGRYTAGAVLSFAYEHDAPILDTNVNRLLGRYFGIAYQETGAEIQHQLWSLAEAVIPAGQAREFNNALMDMGAMVCTARKPKCLLCPVARGCAVMGELADRAAEDRVQYRIREKPPKAPGDGHRAQSKQTADAAAPDIEG